MEISRLRSGWGCVGEFVRPDGTAERELSQLAAGGMTGDGWDNFDDCWSGDALRIGTIRAPGPGFCFGRMVAVRPHPDALGLAHFRLSRWDERRAKIILRWTIEWNRVTRRTALFCTLVLFCCRCNFVGWRFFTKNSTSFDPIKVSSN
jgi:hypothetical protein